MYFRIFCPNQSQGVKPSAANIYPNIDRGPPGVASSDLVLTVIVVR